MNDENKCEHDYFLASKTEEKCKSLGSYGEWEHYKIGTLVCRKCGETKQIKLDECIKRH
jgi:hypothetical protein